MATVHIPAMLRHLTANQDRVEVDIPSGETRTVREVLALLEPRFPGFRGALEVDGALAVSVAVFIDDEQASMELDAKVGPSSTLFFVPPIVGGA